MTKIGIIAVYEIQFTFYITMVKNEDGNSNVCGNESSHFNVLLGEKRNAEFVGEVL